MCSDHILAPARDLIEPDLRLHPSRLNMKAADNGAVVEWHQDHASYPHTKDDILAIGVIIDAMESGNGALVIYPGSHEGPVYNHHVDEVFAEAFLPSEVGLNKANVVELTGPPAGSISIHQGQIVHGFAQNTSSCPQRILFYERMTADAFPVMGSQTNWAGIEDYNARMRCGEPTLGPRLKDIPIRIPQPQPDVPVSICERLKGLGKSGFAGS